MLGLHSTIVNVVVECRECGQNLEEYTVVEKDKHGVYYIQVTPCPICSIPRPSYKCIQKSKEGVQNGPIDN